MYYRVDACYVSSAHLYLHRKKIIRQETKKLNYISSRKKNFIERTWYYCTSYFETRCFWNVKATTLSVSPCYCQLINHFRSTTQAVFKGSEKIRSFLLRDFPKHTFQKTIRPDALMSTKSIFAFVMFTFVFNITDVMH